MEFNWREAILLLFATIGPLKVTIVCASLTAESPPEFLKRVALRSVVVAAAVCLVFAILGEFILLLFNVSIPAFQIGGGIIVLLFSLDMVMGSEKTRKHAEGGDSAGDAPSLDMAVYPLAIPMMASVSGLVAIVSLLSQKNDAATILFLAITILAIMAINYGCLLACRRIVGAIGPSALLVIGKLMGVILTALAIELTLSGLVGLGIVARPTSRTTEAATPASAKDVAP
ncbi:MAG: MarC family protein [Isosphaeraceae bacterium]